MSLTHQRILHRLKGADEWLECRARYRSIYLQRKAITRWLDDLVESGRAFVSVFKQQGKALSAYFAFQIDGLIWEVGGTRPEERAKRLAQGVVRATLEELKQDGRVSRYQMAENNTASVRLAESLGMTPYLTLKQNFSAARSGSF